MAKDLQIRRYQPSDVDAIYEAVVESKTELSNWMPWCNVGYSRNDTKLWVESRATAWDNNLQRSFVVVDGEDKFLGACGIQRLDAENGVAEVGYWIRSSMTCRGIATEATRQICRWAFENQRLHRLEILTSVENLASQRVAEKAGAVREGILKQRFLLNNRRHDCVLFAIMKKRLKRDFLPADLHLRQRVFEFLHGRVRDLGFSKEDGIKAYNPS